MKDFFANVSFYAAFFLASMAFLVIAYYAYHWFTGSVPGPWGDMIIWACCMYIGVIYPFRKKHAGSSRDEA
jgi:hypothetical protein